MRRPASVTVVAVLLIVASVLSLAGSLLQALRPAREAQTEAIMHGVSVVPFGVMMTISVAVAVINLASAVLVLRGVALGRTLYTAIGALMLLLSVLTTRMVLLPFLLVSAVVYAVFVFLLFRPAASQWLRHGRV